MTLGSRNSPSVWIVSHGTSWKTKTRPQSRTSQRGIGLSSAGLPTYLGLGATPASDGRGQGAGTAGALVAHLLTQMDQV